ncbi:S-layer homology domain-containing protein [Paenibacillus sp. 1781tsa1]|uniref:S-layer homology domain-containing protein n=1 Tax=Paenibacillus sp. 1781tsa1 TaxID=2953810 RepID=UPI0020A038BD|nr:S-layer homology domain-containing protein [Paenibacillus sp. 1781tsa1]MCP1187452.1 S-layer homology domain-containing protein [Paenibacillus sp. 1781tsa1]
MRIIKVMLMSILSLVIVTTSAFTPMPIAMAADSIFYVSSIGNDENEGTEEAPFLTMNRALTEITGSGQIVLLSNLSLNDVWTVAASGKTVTITSEEGNRYSILRGEEFKNRDLIRVPNGNITFENVDIDGNHVATNQAIYGMQVTGGKVMLKNVEVRNHYVTTGGSSTASVIAALGGTVVIQDGTRIHHNRITGKLANNPPSLLGAGSGGVVEIQDGIITENEISADGNGVIVGIGLSGKPRFIMTGGQITGNILSGNGIDADGQTIGNVAVYMRGSAADARFDFGGTAYVYDNLNTEGEQRNVYLKNTSATGSAYLTLVNPLQTGAKVGVYANIMPDDVTNPVVDIAIGGGGYLAQIADQSYFVSDINTTAAVAYDNQANKVILTYRLPVNLVLDTPLNLSTVGAKPTLKGSVTSGAVVTITMVNKSDPAKNVVGEATVNPDGTWEFTPSSALSPGEYTLRVTATNNGISAEPVRRDITVVDKSVLQGKYEEITGENLEESKYTSDSWTALHDALNTAEQVLSEPNVTQEQVNNALQELTNARTGLTLVNGGSTAGPGGVGSPSLWLRSDLGMEVTSGQKVSTWEDQGSKVNNATQDEVDNQPTYWNDKNHNINFNPVLEYDGTKTFMNLDVNKLPQGKTARSIITVSKTSKTGGIKYIISWGAQTSGYTGIGMLQNGTRGGLTTFNSTMSQTLYTPEGFLGTTFPNEQFVTWTGGNTESNIARLYSKMKIVQQLGAGGYGQDVPKSWDTGNSGGAVVGKLIPATASVEHWQGTIEEIIVYDHALTDEERQKVSTYLAIKYGYTLDQTTANSYVDSNMATIWDSNVNAAYTHRITSIGRDDQSGLLQKQAKAQELGSMLTIALGNRIEDTNSANQNNISNDSSFFMFGDNGASTEFKTPITKDEKKLLGMERIYKVQKANWTESQITLQVDVTGGSPVLPQYLVISDDAQFGNPNSLHLIQNGQVTLNTSNFGPDSYFTIATAATPLSAPVITVIDDELTWEAVEHADKYEVTIEMENGTKRTVEVPGTVLNLSQLEPPLKAGAYTVTVTAKTNNPAYADSEASNGKSYVVIIDKAKLKAKIDEINGKIETGELDTEEYTPETWQTLQTALEVAQSVFDDENATSEQVEKAYQDLVDAQEGLTKNPGTGIDTSALKSEYDRIKAENLTEAEYTPGSWVALDNAMNEAERVLNDPTATQAQVDQALQDLTDARTGLTKVIGNDTSTLQTLIPSTGSLSPAFDPAKDTYTISVPNSVYQFQLTPTALDPLAKIEIAVGDGEWNEVSSGTVSENLPLQVGGNKIVVRVTDSLGNVTEYKINVTRASGDNGNNSGGNNGGGGNTGGGNGGSTPAPAPVPTPTPAPVKDNLETTRDGSHQPFATSKPSDNKETLVQVDPAKLKDAMSQGTGQQFAIHSPNDGDMKVDGLTLETLKQLVDQGSKLNISNPLAIYPVPGGKMDLNGVSGQLGNAALNDIDVHIDIARSSDTLIDSAETRAASQGYELLVTPVDLDLTFSKDGQTVRSGLLNGYAPKYIALPEGIDPNRITTGVIINPDGSIFHVPTVVTKVDSRYYALINDLRSSGSYSVIWNPQDFEDARSHWGKIDVNNIAARLDLKGNGDNTFSPNRQVTRSEFAEIVVLGLGLMRQDAPQNLFPDVNNSAWFRNAVALANEFGIVRGYDNGNFYGNQEITREQGFAMVARAYRLIEPEASISPDQVNAELERYSDAANVSNWAKEDVAQLIAAGIIQGNGPEILSPKTTMTRAEVTALIARMLKVTNLIDQ